MTFRKKYPFKSAAENHRSVHIEILSESFCLKLGNFIEDQVSLSINFDFPNENLFLSFRLACAGHFGKTSFVCKIELELLPTEYKSCRPVFLSGYN